MPANATTADPGRDDADRVDALVATYIDRLNAGENISADKILEEHPDLGLARGELDAAHAAVRGFTGEFVHGNGVLRGSRRSFGGLLTRALAAAPVLAEEGAGVNERLPPAAGRVSRSGCYDKRSRVAIYR